MALVERLTPDVVVMDLTMGDAGGAEATAEITKRGLASRVLILTMHAEEDYLVPLLEAGAAGYLMKGLADRDLVEAVRTVARGELYVHPSAARVLAKGITRKDPLQAERDRFERLTPRERDVLRLVAEGYSAPEIGERLFISPKTVDTYKQPVNRSGLRHGGLREDGLRLGLMGG